MSERKGKAYVEDLSDVFADVLCEVFQLCDVGIVGDFSLIGPVLFDRNCCVFGC